jgi:hypothetical protein
MGSASAADMIALYVIQRRVSCCRDWMRVAVAGREGVPLEERRPKRIFPPPTDAAAHSRCHHEAISPGSEVPIAGSTVFCVINAAPKEAGVREMVPEKGASAGAGCVASVASTSADNLAPAVFSRNTPSISSRQGGLWRGPAGA